MAGEMNFLACELLLLPFFALFHFFVHFYSLFVHQVLCSSIITAMGDTEESFVKPAPAEESDQEDEFFSDDGEEAQDSSPSGFPNHSAGKRREGTSTTASGSTVTTSSAVKGEEEEEIEDRKIALRMQAEENQRARGS